MTRCSFVRGLFTEDCCSKHSKYFLQFTPDGIIIRYIFPCVGLFTSNQQYPILKHPILKHMI